MLTTTQISEITDMLFFNTETMTMECNYCNKGDYEFSELESLSPKWFRDALFHYSVHHPVKVESLVRS